MAISIVNDEQCTTSENGLVGLVDTGSGRTILPASVLAAGHLPTFASLAYLTEINHPRTGETFPVRLLPCELNVLDVQVSTAVAVAEDGPALPYPVIGVDTLAHFRIELDFGHVPPCTIWEPLGGLNLGIQAPLALPARAAFVHDALQITSGDLSAAPDRLLGAPGAVPAALSNRQSRRQAVRARP